MSQFTRIFREKSYYYFLPLIVAFFPAFFHYANNSRVLLISSLGKLLILLLVISAVSWAVFLIIYKGRALISAIAASIYLVLFHTYGSLFELLRQWDIFKIDHYMLLPAYILLAVYIGWLTSRINEKSARVLWEITSIIMLSLIVFNIIKILPVEIEKHASPDLKPTPDIASQITQINQSFPDVYFIVFDEMAGFEAVRQYWKYDDIDSFVAYLEAKGFFIAENSHGASDNTYHELANRMDYELYPYDPSKFQKYWNEALDHLSSNKVLSFFKSLGYSTVVFDEGLPITTRLKADVVYTSSLNEMLSWGSIYDEFGLLVLNNTMFKPFISKMITNNTAITDHERMLVFAAEQVISPDIQSPKFVFIHLLIPHMPFLFNADGHRIGVENQFDWDQYLGYYVFSTQYARSMIDKILASTSPDHSPIIVFQSDHGARNIPMESGNILLQNYPSEYLTLIVNALYLPGCEDAPLSQDMNPINTFPIIFNCYFDAKIPLK